jgi:MoaA/NifB/PqqE/SkfB family radical SAM enzyme
MQVFVVFSVVNGVNYVTLIRIVKLVAIMQIHVIIFHFIFEVYSQAPVGGITGNVRSGRDANYSKGANRNSGNHNGN